MVHAALELGIHVIDFFLVPDVDVFEDLPKVLDKVLDQRGVELVILQELHALLDFLPDSLLLETELRVDHLPDLFEVFEKSSGNVVFESLELAVFDSEVAVFLIEQLQMVDDVGLLFFVPDQAFLGLVFVVLLLI